MSTNIGTLSRTAPLVHLSVHEIGLSVSKIITTPLQTQFKTQIPSKKLKNQFLIDFFEKGEYNPH